MPSPQPVQIITIYSAGQSKGARGRIRLLALLSLLVAAVWLMEAAYPKKVPVLGWDTVDRWIKLRLELSAISQGSEFLQTEQQGLLVALGLAPLVNTRPHLTEEQQKALEKAYEGRMTVLFGGFYLWKGLAILAGAWLALAGLVGLLGLRASRRLHRQAATLMILSTLATVAGIYVAIRWGGMPPIPDLTLYAKIAAVQSSYAWFLLIATPFLR